MIFSNDKPIYIQMADRLCDEILSGVYKDDDRIPSVREYAVLLEVNTNTAVKAYEQLAREEIIYNKRGLGYFVTKGAPARVVPTDAAARHNHRRRDRGIQEDARDRQSIKRPSVKHCFFFKGRFIPLQNFAFSSLFRNFAQPKHLLR